MPKILTAPAFSMAADQVPVQHGTCRLVSVSPDNLTSIMVYDSAQKDLAAAFRAAHGIGLPGPNRTSGAAKTRAVWHGRGQVMLIGPVADPGLAAYAALSDQSDAWAIVTLTGAHSEAVLSRLMPLDFSTMKRGHAARSLLHHTPASIARIGVQRFQIMVFRSMAETLHHDVCRAMRSVAAQFENEAGDGLDLL